ncbi:hypothetical protein ACKI18_19415 [Streptomyces niveiscabiei]|uniref:Uncharacterized protein n=2 Tax=Streptomyces niveiscabiei TaxID=164115 RepID=A0ABW9HS08_9ACTN
MKSREFLRLLRGSVDADSTVRMQVADEITDLLSAYSLEEVVALAVTLSAAAAAEENPEVLESQLHAILELATTGYVDVGCVSYLREIDPVGLPGEIKEYIADLLAG